MAFEAKGLGIHPSSTGGGGFATYISGVDDMATVRGSAYWQSVRASGWQTFERKGIEALISFIELQGVPIGGIDLPAIPIWLISSNAAQWNCIGIHPGNGALIMYGATDANYIIT